MKQASSSLSNQTSAASRRRRRRSRGYVLVLVLGLLVLSATLLVAVSRAAGRAAVAARAAEDDLRRRWGVASCRKAVLPYVDQALARLEQERRRPAASCAVTVRLGPNAYELILGDEQAKANVNAMLEASDVTRIETRIRQGLTGSGLANRIKLRPTVGPVVLPNTAADEPAAPVAGVNALRVGAWGQVFDEVPAVQLFRPMAGSRLAALDLLTCWGTGAINVSRTTDAALALAAGRSLTGVEITRLIEARDKVSAGRAAGAGEAKSPVEELKDLIAKAAGESAKNQGNLGLTLGSKCHSLCVITRTGRRDGYDLFVSDRSNDQRPVVWAFSW